MAKWRHSEMLWGAVFSAALVLSASGGWETAPGKVFYKASFEEYATGEELDSEKGAVGGFWKIPSDVVTRAAADGARYYMNYASGDNGIVFLPSDGGDRAIKSVRLSVCAIGNETLPEMSSSDRAGFAVYAPDGGESTFQGWTAQGWRKISSSAIAPLPDVWYEVLIQLMRGGDGIVRVKYWVKTDGSFVPLADDDGQQWLAAGGAAGTLSIAEVEFSGDGAVELLEGSEPKRGLLIGLSPWREVFIEETVDKNKTGHWQSRPGTEDGAYRIVGENGEDYSVFRPKQDTVDALRRVEFVVRFENPNDDDSVDDSHVALMRVIDEDPQDAREDSVYHFACLVNGRWATNELVSARLDVDYTAEITLDGSNNAVGYRIREGRGHEGGAYQSLFTGTHDLTGEMELIFGGNGLLYEIISSWPSNRK